MKIGPYQLANRLILAPMAGVTDLPFRRLCKRHGAGLVVSEMVSSKPELRQSAKTQLRLNHHEECSPRIVQIAGGDAEMMAIAAKYNQDLGAEIIDINMGCPAKKVCNKAAGSALLRNEKLVTEILEAVVKAVTIPVTLKIRTGWSRDENNALAIANIAENSGIQALAIHGRSRACMFKSEIEYDTVKAVKQSISIPVIANGDITSAKIAKNVIDSTGVDAVMIGRAAQGRPWIFEEIDYYLKHGKEKKLKTTIEIISILQQHLQALYDFYGEYMGVRIARKHVGWYLKNFECSQEFRQMFNKIEHHQQQLNSLESIV